MRDLIHRHSRRAALAALLIMPVALLATSAGAGVGQRAQRAPARHARAGLALSQSAGAGLLATAGGWLDGLWGDATQEEELEALRQENATLREEKARLIGVLQENARLRELVGFKLASPELTLVPARVVARNTSPYFRVLTVTLRVDAQVRARMPVVVAGGVVGQVHVVQGQTAQIILLADPRSRVDVISQRNRAHGVAQGLGRDRDYEARIAYLSQADEVRQGDVMVTSGMGGLFPRELIVGKVARVALDEQGLFQEAVLEPAVDLSRLDEVFIVTNLAQDAPADASAGAP